MSTPNGTGNGTGRHAAAAGSRPVVLLRHRAERDGTSARIVHLAPLPADARLSVLTALCGTLLHPDDVEQVTPGQGVPCHRCTVSHLGTRPAEPPPPVTGPAPEPDAVASSAAATYREWGWPVLLRGDQVWLALGTAVTALVIPAEQAGRAASVLTERRCPPAVLTHPDAPRHRVLLAGEPYPVPLPWPLGVHRVATSVLLPPTPTPRGPLTWHRPPLPTALTMCREIDVLAALRTDTDPGAAAF